MWTHFTVDIMCPRLYSPSIASGVSPEAEEQVMKCFVFANVVKLTTSYHSYGGAVAVAVSLDKARELILAAGADGGGITTAEPTAEYSVSDDAPEAGWCFPDAGCC